MTPEEQVRLMKSSGHVHSIWYRETYPDVASLGLDPATHYLRYGAAMGRNPGKNFDTRGYLKDNPEVEKSGMNPLVHYQLYGRAKGASTKPSKAPEKKLVSVLRTKLLSLGFTERPLAELDQIRTNATRPDARALAARELALWHMRAKTPEGWREALRFLDSARSEGPDLAFCRKLAVVELLCHYLLNSPTDALAAYERAVDAGELSPDLLLARANLEPTANRRIRFMNRVLAHYDITPIMLGGDESLPAYDRLTAAQPLPQVTDGPKVTVLIAAYDAADTLPTALRSLQEQTWQNLEILVLDDCSPTPETCRVAGEFAASDPRIRVIRMEQNGGAYVARNRGLDEATGEYVTLHDADDWSHPQKIETQIRFLLDNPDVVGCLSEQARVFSDLGFTRWAADGVFLIPNTSSFMFHKPRMQDRLGYWDTVRFSADNELIRRMQAVFGKDAVQFLPTGPLSFQRDSATSIIADAVMGVNGFLMGVRREYLHAQSHYRKLPKTELKFSADRTRRPYPVPLLMLPDRAEQIKRQQHLDVIVGADLRIGSGSGILVLAELRKLRRAGLSVGVFEMNRYDYHSPKGSHISPEARSALWDMGVRILSFGETTTCDSLLLVDPGILKEHQRYLPNIRPTSATIICADGMIDNELAEGTLKDFILHTDACATATFGCVPTWHVGSAELLTKILAAAGASLQGRCEASPWTIANTAEGQSEKSDRKALDLASTPAPDAPAKPSSAGRSIPASSGKTSATALADLPIINVKAGELVSASQTALLHCEFNGHRFDYLWSPKPGAQRLFVLFSGDAQRKRFNPPVFQRWSWAEHFPGHCLYVSDPMLHMAKDLGLAWYAGTAEVDPMEVIIRRVKAMLPLVALTSEDVVAYGSSGGGFAALRMAAMMPGASAVAINPQTNIARYNFGSPDRYARTCLGRKDRHEALRDFPMRMDLLRRKHQLKDRRIVLIQNILDHHHHSDHYLPLCEAMGASGEENRDTGLFRRILFSHEGGHGKAETPEVFAAAMAILESDTVDSLQVRQRA